MTLILGHYQNVRSGISQGGLVAVIPPVEMATTTDTAVEYNPATVKKILAARKGKLANAPKDPDAFLAWLLS